MFKANVSLKRESLTTYLVLYHPSLSCSFPFKVRLSTLFLTALPNSHLSVHRQCPLTFCNSPDTRYFESPIKMFSFSQSDRDRALHPAGKCLSVSHPSRGCVCGPQESRAASPRYKPSRYPAPQRKNPLPRHLLPLPAVTPESTRTHQWSPNPVGRRWEGAGLIGSCRWLRIRGSSSSEKSDVSV